MEVPDGMMAVVRGMQNTALCVTLLDGNRKYTLLPNSAVPVTNQPASTAQSTQKMETVLADLEKCRCDSSAQAVDGRYASTYKMTHCKVAPTSPPVALTEFPPQRAEICPGQGNFEVGGLGSGENNFTSIRNPGSFRGGMCWPDRGAVCNPRPSHSPDAFASSLRKYPSMSPERSAELVERLINYSQFKNTKVPKNASPTRSESPLPNLDRLSRSTRRLEQEYTRCCSPEESPTREKQRFEETEYRRVYGRSYDVRYIREFSRRTRDSVRNVSTYPYSHPVCPTIKERYDHLPPEQKYLAEQTTSSYVHMETQAEIPMISREVTTVPRVQPSMRNVAIPISPSSSNSETKANKCLRNDNDSKSVQTTEAEDLTLKKRKSVQTCFSSVDIQESKKLNNKRKSKSQEELRVNDDDEEEIVQLIEDLTSCPDFDKENVIRSKLLRKLRKIHKIDRSERVKIKIGRCIKDQLYSEIDLKNFTRELSNELISKIKRHNIFIENNPNIYRAEACSLKSNPEENCVDEIIKEWLNDIPIKSIDYLGRDVKKGHLLRSIATKVRTLIINKLKYNSDSTMKSDIIEIIEDIPIDISGHNKRFYINRLVSELMKRIKSIFTSSHAKRKWKKNPCKYFQLTEKEIKLFVRAEIAEFTVKFQMKVCPESLKKMERELTGVLMDSIEIIRLGNIEDVKEDILEMLADFVGISEQQAIYLANNMIYNLKDMFDQSHYTNKARSQTFMVLQSSLQNQTGYMNKAENSIEAISKADIDINLNRYTNQIVQQINEWANNIKGFEETDSGFRQVVVNDLAGDIVDRHKYLELNSSSKTTDSDELEHLKYQIFKWINKVSGEYNLDTIDRAPDLMKRIQSVPVPMLTMPQKNNKSSLLCCENANKTVPNIKPEAIQSTSKGRRLSSPEGYKQTSEPIEPTNTVVLTGKQFMEQIKQQDAATQENSDCCKPHDETTESKFNASMGVTSTPKKMAPPTDKDKVQHRMQQPQGPSVSMVEQPTNKPPLKNKRLSLPTGSGSKEHDTEAAESILGSPSRSNKIDCCTNTGKGAVPHESQSIKQLNDEYDDFVRDWVQKIPIAASTPAEQALADKARQGIYNGIWKIITKLKMNPATMHNPFYYQDVFDDEIEELLNLLPQTPELINKKHAMKAQLIEKTTAMNDMIVSAAGPSTYKQQLVENVSNNLPGSKIENTENDGKQYEELLKMNLVENFILYTKFKSYDKVKANVFKKKVMREVHELIDSVKANHGKELKDIDAAAYVEEVITALQKVPLPSDDTIREEADEINIGLEIEQWFSDLPLLPSNNNVEELGRRRHKDALAKKIHEIERQSPLTEWKDKTKEEVRRFLAKMPLKQGEADSLNFMVEELANRLKNRPTDIIALGADRRKSVSFMDAYEYDDFSRDMPACSSFSDLGRPAQANQSSYMIADGTRVKDNDPYAQYINLGNNTPESQQQWYTLEESNAPPDLKSPSQANKQTAPPCCTNESEGPTSLAHPQPTSHTAVTSSSSQTPKVHEPTIPENSILKCCDSPERSNQSSQRIVRHSIDQGTQQFDHEENVDLSPQRCDRSTQHFELSPENGVEGENDNKTCEVSCKSRRSSAPPSYRTQGTEPIGTNTHSQPKRQIYLPKTTIPSAPTCDPIGFSQEPCGHSPRPKRTKDMERKKDARRRLVMEDTDESDEEVRCRCMEKVWRCRRKPGFRNYDDDYVPCFMGYPPHPCFF